MAPGRAVFARHAASLLVVREGPAGPEVLMGVRGAAHRFMPNRLVFPGGAVDRGDGRRLAGSEPSPALLAMLGRSAGPRMARAIAVAAARELREETGLTLGTPPRLDGLHYLCRAVTPPDSPIRFNARFLVVDAAHVTGTVEDSRELQMVQFRPVASLRDEALVLVTREVLGRLVMWLALPAGERDGRMLEVFQERDWTAERALETGVQPRRRTRAS